MKNFIKIVLSFCLFFQFSIARASEVYSQKIITGQDTIALLAATCSEKNWESLRKWNGFNYYQSIQMTNETAVIKDSQVYFPESKVTVSAQPDGLTLKDQTAEFRGSDFCDLILNVDHPALKKSAWQVFGLISQAYAAEPPDITKAKKEYMKSIVAGVMGGTLTCATGALATTLAAPVAAPVSVPLAAICGLIFAGATITGAVSYGFSPSELSTDNKSAVSAINFEKVMSSPIKLNSCKAGQVIIQDANNRLIATKVNSSWKYEMVNISGQPVSTIAAVNPFLVRSRVYIDQISKQCIGQADVDRINSEIKIFQSEAKTRIASLSGAVPSSAPKTQKANVQK